MKSKNFAARLKQENLATKVHIADLAEKTNFDDKLKNLNKRFTLNKIKHVETEKNVTDLTNKIAQILECGRKVFHK